MYDNLKIAQSILESKEGEKKNCTKLSDAW